MISNYQQKEDSDTYISRCQSIWLVKDEWISNVVMRVLPMQEPRTIVICRESESNIVACNANVHYVTSRLREIEWLRLEERNTHRVDVVVGWTSRASYHIECMTVQMERMSSSNYTARNADFDGLIRRKWVNRTSRKQILSTLRAGKNLKQDGNCRREKWHVVDSESEIGLFENNVWSGLNREIKVTKLNARSRFIAWSTPPATAEPIPPGDTTGWWVG